MLTVEPKFKDMVIPWEKEHKMFIYKIENDINDKLYIGLTTVTIECRWKNHLQASKKNAKPLYKDMRKYGTEHFKITPICEAYDFEKLGNLERYYIKTLDTIFPRGYNLTCGGQANRLDGNPRATLTVDDVINIRDIYASLMTPCSKCYELYKEKISFSAFEKIWEGITWKSVHSDVYTDDNKGYHKNYFKVCRGEKNGNGISDDDILKARLYYITHNLKNTYAVFGSRYISIDSFRHALTKSYSHIPMYHKISNTWTLCDEEINIKEYFLNPVSTISVSGE